MAYLKYQRCSLEIVIFGKDLNNSAISIMSLQEDGFHFWTETRIMKVENRGVSRISVQEIHPGARVINTCYKLQ